MVLVLLGLILYCVVLSCFSVDCMPFSITSLLTTHVRLISNADVLVAAQAVYQNHSVSGNNLFLHFSDFSEIQKSYCLYLVTSTCELWLVLCTMIQHRTSVLQTCFMLHILVLICRCKCKVHARSLLFCFAKIDHFTYSSFVNVYVKVLLGATSFLTTLV